MYIEVNKHENLCSNNIQIVEGYKNVVTFIPKFLVTLKYFTRKYHKLIICSHVF